MGKTIEGIAQGKGHEIVLIIDKNNAHELTEEQLKAKGVEVAIEFTRPESAVANLKGCISAGVPVVSGTTGWLDRYEEVKAFCEAKQSAFLYASNFSVGVNIFFELNRQLAQMMKMHENYEPSLHEIHHTQKLDAPSGTGITLANDLMEIITRKKKWVNDSTANTKNTAELALTSERIDKVPGTHIVTYASAVDTIAIQHTAHSRIGFASGAVVAAEWLVGKKGVFSMRDVLGF